MGRGLRQWWWAAAAVALIASGCGAGGDATPTSTTAGQDAAVATGEEVMFGELESPCGGGDARVADGEGPSTDALVLGVPNDRGAEAVGRPGLNRELWDASQAFTTWCNEQGGIQGLDVQLVELDGKATPDEAAVTQACSGVFAMVGGVSSRTSCSSAATQDRTSTSAG